MQSPCIFCVGTWLMACFFEKQVICCVFLCRKVYNGRVNLYAFNGKTNGVIGMSVIAISGFDLPHKNNHISYKTLCMYACMYVCCLITWKNIHLGNHFASFMSLSNVMFFVKLLFLDITHEVVFLPDCGTSPANIKNSL